MPSSVVFAALVLAWLVVLVPVVARRRQMVPRPAEADLSARVLPRTTGAPQIEEVPVAAAQKDGKAQDGRAVAAGSAGSTGSTGRPRAAGTILAERADESLQAVDAELDLDADRGDLDDLDDAEDVDALDETDHGDRRGSGRERVLRRRTAPEDTEDPRYSDADDEYVDHDDRYDDEDDDRYDDMDDDEYEYKDDDRAEEPAERALRPYRPGRGGFDPDAAAEVAHARYAFRQRIALGLIAVAVLSALAALVLTSVMWWLHAVADVVLVGYLFFLRRQTRIEEDVRTRRIARLSGERRALEARRARQAEHDARMAALREQDWIDGYYETEDDGAGHDDRYDEDDDGHEDDPPNPVTRAARSAPAERDADRWTAPRTPPPPVPEDLELVDDSDEDPAFHDLDGERSYGYRRAAGA